jgi:hypothetical protein
VRNAVAAAALAVLASASPVSAQVDPLGFLKTQQPNVMIVMDTSERMQRDAPADPANPMRTSNYYDPFIYTRVGGSSAAWEASLGVTDANTSAAPNGTYRRKYNHFAYTSGTGATTASITVVGDKDAGYASFEAPTRLALARAALYQAVQENMNVARFGLYKMRQSTASLTRGNLTNVQRNAVFPDTAQQATDFPSLTGRWTATRAAVSSANGAAASTSALLVKADLAGQNAAMLSILAKDVRTAIASGGLISASLDDAATIDAPVQFMIDDMKTEALRLWIAEPFGAACRTTVAVLITGGADGNTGGGNAIAAASAFLLGLASRRTPIIVVAIAPPAADVVELKGIAAASGGQYFEITKAQVDAALASPIQAGTGALDGTVLVPELVDAINHGVQTAFQDFNDINTKPFWAGPWKGWKGYAGSPIIPSSEFQVTSPIIATVNLERSVDVNGVTLPLTTIEDKSHNVIPQRSNLLITAGFTLPGFDGILRGFRQYTPKVDPTAVSGYTFESDGTPLWIASIPADPNQRNLYTALPDGQVIAFTVAHSATLAPLMNLTVADATSVIASVRAMPIGAIIDSTPAVMNAPSLDPPPDTTYPAFAAGNKLRRSMIWVGTNRGVLEGIDARFGVEVWGFIPLNLLPKLRTLRDGQSIGRFDFFTDGSAKITDVKYDGEWHTHLTIGQGPGGSFYQTFDVTMADQAAALGGTNPDRDATLAQVLGYFSSAAAIRLKWSFPSYSNFDPTVNFDPANGRYGDLKATAPAIEKSVGQAWSDPAVGQVMSNAGPYTVMVGSGFYQYTYQQLANRGGAVAGTTFYVLNARDGTVLATEDVGSDNLNETVDDCRTAVTGCKQLKNALQSGPVASGAADSRFVTKVYIGDLDGNVWRFNLTLDAGLKPAITTTTKLYSAGADQPIVNSMATVNVGGTNQYLFFGTGGDLLPGTDKDTVNHLLGILDNGVAVPGAKALDQALTKTAGSGTDINVDEKVTSFPAVAGDIVFFTTTTFKPALPCSLPDAKLYAFTFIGGAAYDSTGDNKITVADKPLVKTIAGERATAPSVVDRHLVFGAGGQISVFGESEDYNNGVGQAGVRILSWREVR